PVRPPGITAAAPASSRTAPAVQPTHDPGGENDVAATIPFPPDTFPITVSGTVRAGDVVTVTDGPDDQAALAGQALDKGVIGIVGGAAGGRRGGRGPPALSGGAGGSRRAATTGGARVGGGP